MMFDSQSVSYLAGNSEATGSWSGTRSPRWVRISSRPVADICITEYIWAIARLFTIRDSRTVCAEAPWKKLRWLISHVASASG